MFGNEKTHHRIRTILAVLAVSFAVISCGSDTLIVPPGIIITVAGTGQQGFAGEGEDALEAQFDAVGDVAADALGNLFICDIFNHRIRRIDGQTNIITTIAGTGYEADPMNDNGDFGGDGGPAVEALLSRPRHLVQDAAGNILFLDLANHRVRKIEANTGIITTIVGDGSDTLAGDGGAAVDASIGRPHGIALDGAGNIYIAEFLNHRIRKVTISTGIIETIAGSGSTGFAGGGFSGDGGPAVEAELKFPAGGAFDPAGNYYFSDAGNNRVRKIDLATGIITTVAGTGEPGYAGDGGAAVDALLQSPRPLEIDSKNRLYIGDTNNHVIRMVDLNTGIIETIAGTGLQGYFGDGGPAINARLDQPFGIELDERTNSLYIASAGNHVIRRMGLPE